MKLATLRRGGRDGTLIVVDRQLRHATTVPKIARTLQEALEDWPALQSRLLDVYERLNAGGIDTSFALRVADLASPLPRCYERLVARARTPEAGFDVTNGASGSMSAARDPIRIAEAGQRAACVPAVAAITDEVPVDVEAAGAGAHVRLLALLVDHTPVGAAVPPSTALSPVVASPDELGDAWRDHHVHGAIAGRSGDDEAVECAGADAIDFATFVLRAARGRGLLAGSVLSVPTPPPQALCVSAGGRVRVEWWAAPGSQLFGAIDRDVVAPSAG